MPLSETGRLNALCGGVVQGFLKLIGSHDKFVVNVADEEGDIENKQPLVLLFDETNVIKILPWTHPTDSALSAPYAFVDSWSVFQAIYELAENSVAYAGISQAPSLGSVTTNDANGISRYRSSSWLIFWNSPEIVVDQSSFFQWDVLSHEYGHAIADQNNSIIAVGGSHNGSNQYDYNQSSYPNPQTYRNKTNSNRLAFNEAYGTWFGVSFWRKSQYASIHPDPYIGDEFYDDSPSGIRYSLESNNTSANGSVRIYGEDSEMGVGRFLWDIVDSVNENNTRAACNGGCQDVITLDLAAVMGGAINGKRLDGVSDFYKHFYKLYTGKFPVEIDSIGNSDSSVVRKTIELGALAAEFGLAANLRETDNIDLFNDIDNPSNRDLTVNPVRIEWRQHKTGTMPGLDRFEILFFNETLDKLLYKIDAGTISPTSTSPDVFEFTLSQIHVRELIDSLLESGFKETQRLSLIIKGTASGAGVINDPVETGPYYGNAAGFEVELNSKLAVIAVDSSGSNEWTDPGNLRIAASNSMLANMVRRNDDVLMGSVTGRPVAAAALDFDEYVRVLSDFSDPQNILGIFNAIDSYGGTDIASAINRSVNMINAARPVPGLPFSVNENTPRLYLLSDMDNGTGIMPVVTAILNANNNNIVTNLGHLIPLSVRATPLDLRGESYRNKVSEPMDPIIEAILAGGGSYAVIEDATAQQAWVDLMDELNNSNPGTRTEVNLPFDIKLYGYAQTAGLPEPAYIISAAQGGTVTIIVDGKGNFIPDVKRDGVGVQSDIGEDQYELTFPVTAGGVYRIELNEPISAVGLYSIVARFTPFAPIVSAPQAIPVNNPLALLMGIAFIFLVASAKKIKYN